MKRWAILAVVMTLAAAAPASAQPGLDGSLSESFRATLVGGGVASQGLGLSDSVGRGDHTPGGSITITGVPAGASVHRAFLYWAVWGGDDDTVTLAGSPVSGAMIGRSSDTCWGPSIVNPQPEHDNRVYRADVTARVPGNGTYPLSGVGDQGGDAQGASLVVVYADPSAATRTTVIVNDGALSAFFQDRLMSHRFHNLPSSAQVISASLNVGVGDTSGSFDEGPMTVSGTQVAPTSFFNGSDGAYWDDHTLAVPTAAVAWNSVDNELNNGNDCMVWVYAALSVTERLPQVTITSPHEGAYVGRGVRIAGEAGAEVESVVLDVDGQPAATAMVVDGAWSGGVDAPDGWRSIGATARNADGMPLGDRVSVSVTVDSSPPGLEVDSGKAPRPHIGTYFMEGRTWDDNGVDRVEVTWQRRPGGEMNTVIANCSGCGWPNQGEIHWWAEFVPPPGPITIRATAYDLAGNVTRQEPPVLIIAGPFGDGPPIEWPLPFEPPF